MDVSPRLERLIVSTIAVIGSLAEHDPSNEPTTTRSKSAGEFREVFQRISRPAGSTNRCTSFCIAAVASASSPFAGTAYNASVRVCAWQQIETNNESNAALNVNDMVTLHMENEQPGHYICRSVS